MHSHTAEVSRCATIKAEELVRYYKAHGFSGICITDHFFNGNTTVLPKLKWEEKVEAFASGYKKALIEGDRVGVNVFFGWEYTYQGTDFLTYNLDIEWLMKHPEIMDMSTNEYLDFARSEGGFIVHSQPFREQAYIPMIRLLPRRVDAVEVHNAGRTEKENILADQYAYNYDLLKTVGSDTHHYGNHLDAMLCKDKHDNLEDVIYDIKMGDVKFSLGEPGEL